MADNTKQDFAKRLSGARKAAKLKQIDLAVGIGKDKSVISRAENANDAYIPPTGVFTKMKEELRQHGCLDEDLTGLEEAWRSAQRRAGKRVKGLDDPVIQDITDALNMWPAASPERSALVDALRAETENWRSYQMAMEELQKGDPLFASETLENIYHKTSEQPRLKMRVLIGLAYVQRYLGKADEALTGPLAEALAITEGLGALEVETCANILLLQGNFHRRLGQLKEALGCYERGMEKFKTIADRRVQTLGLARADRKIAGIFLFQGRSIEAEARCRTSIQRCVELGDRDEQRKGEQHRAWALAMLGEFDQALSLHESILKRIEGARVSLVQAAKAKRYYADMLRMSGRLEEAEHWYLEARQNLKDNAEPRLEEEETLLRGPIWLGLGETYRKMGRLDEAGVRLRESERVNRNDPFFLAQTERELGRWVMEQGGFAEAARRFDRAYALFSERENIYYTAAMQVTQAELALCMERPEAARELAQGLINRAGNNPDLTVPLIRAYVQLAAASIMSNAGDPIGEYFEALRVSEELDNPYLYAEVLDAFNEQLVALKGKGREEMLKRLCGGINGWRSRMRPSNPRMKDKLKAWFEEVQRIACS